MNIDLDAIQARADAATEGPWEVERYPHGGGRIWKKQDNGNRSLVADTFGGEGNREFLLAARTDVPVLLAYARDLEARLKEAGAEALEEAADGWSDWDALQAPEDWLRARAAELRKP